MVEKPVLPVTSAGVTLIDPGRDPHYIAASDGAVLRFEQQQPELGLTAATPGPWRVAGGAAAVA